MDRQPKEVAHAFALTTAPMVVRPRGSRPRPAVLPGAGSVPRTRPLARQGCVESRASGRGPDAFQGEHLDTVLHHCYAGLSKYSV